jgi:hypothetical protein
MTQLRQLASEVTSWSSFEHDATLFLAWALQIVKMNVIALLCSYQCRRYTLHETSSSSNKRGLEASLLS